MKRFRMLDWLLFALALAVLIYLIAPHQLPVTAYKLHVDVAGGLVAFFFDRAVAPYARPDAFLGLDGKPKPGCELAFASSQLRRALIISAGIIATALGA